METRKNTNSMPSQSTGKTSIAHKVGDAIERVGEKLQQMGATKAGKAVYRAGDKIEHSQDKKNQ